MTNLLGYNEVAVLAGTALGIIICLEWGIIVGILVSQKRGRRTPQKRSAKEKTVYSAIFLANTALLSAMGVVLLYFEFPIFSATPWLEMNFSDVPTLLAAFMYGPVTGAVVNVIKIVVKLLISGSTTNLVGPLSNLISGTIYAVVAGLIYKLRRNKKGAILSLFVGSLVFCAAMWLCNQFILLPFYGMTAQEIMMPALWWTLLFNVIKTAATCVITFILYKPLSRALHWTIDPARRKKKQSPQDTQQADAPRQPDEPPPSAVPNDSEN